MGVTIDPSFDFPAADLRHQLSGLRRPRQEHAAGRALRRRARARQSAAHEGVRRTARRAASISSRLPCRRTIASTAPTGEREAERLLTWPLNIGGNLGWQVNAFHKLTGQLSVPLRRLSRRYDHRRRLRHPAGTITNGLGGGDTVQSASVTPSRANGTWSGAWVEETGVPDVATEEPHSTYAKYSVNLSRTSTGTPSTAAPEWRLVRRRRPRSVHAVPVRPVR